MSVVEYVTIARESDKATQLTKEPATPAPNVISVPPVIVVPDTVNALKFIVVPPVLLPTMKNLVVLQTDIPVYQGSAPRFKALVTSVPNVSTLAAIVPTLAE